MTTITITLQDSLGRPTPGKTIVCRRGAGTGRRRPESARDQRFRSNPVHGQRWCERNGRLYRGRRNRRQPAHSRLGDRQFHRRLHIVCGSAAGRRLRLLDLAVGDRLLCAEFLFRQRQLGWLCRRVEPDLHTFGCRVRGRFSNRRPVPVRTQRRSVRREKAVQSESDAGAANPRQGWAAVRNPRRNDG